MPFNLPGESLFLSCFAVAAAAFLFSIHMHRYTLVFMLLLLFLVIVYFFLLFSSGRGQQRQYVTFEILFRLRKFNCHFFSSSFILFFCLWNSQRDFFFENGNEWNKKRIKIILMCSTQIFMAKRSF